MNKLLLIVLFIVLYCWSSKIIDDNGIDARNDSIGIKKYSGILLHNESTNNWIFDSSVCLSGQIVFYLWSIVLVLSLFISEEYKQHMKKILSFLAFLTIFITAILNMPLFIRSIPAFIVLTVIINS